jgi:Ni,Fe-hydrogenase maturation factor
MDAKEIKPIKSPSPHSVGVPYALQIAKRFQLNIPEEIKIIGVQVKDITLLSENLTKEVELSLEKVHHKAKEIIDEWLGE